MFYPTFVDNQIREVYEEKSIHGADGGLAGYGVAHDGTEKQHGKARNLGEKDARYLEKGEEAGE